MRAWGLCLAVLLVGVGARHQLPLKKSHNRAIIPQELPTSSRTSNRHSLKPVSAARAPRSLEEDGLQVTYKDEMQLPGLASVVEWQGDPNSRHNIYLGDWAEPRSTWTLVESGLLLNNHATVGGTTATPTTLRKSLARHHDHILLDPHVIVCADDDVDVRDEAALEREGLTPKSKCGHDDMIDEYDRNDWWTKDGAPRATHIPFVRSNGNLRHGGTYMSACANKFRGILHTTQAKWFTPSTTSYYGHTSPPHFTVVYYPNEDNSTKSPEVKTFQHLPLSKASRALYNGKGGVQTNRQCAVQIEIAWLAEEITDMSDLHMAEVKELVAWISQQKNIPLETVEYFDDRNVHRFPNALWNDFSGWCGHQHVPENSHWDPGVIGGKPTEPADGAEIDWSTSTLYTKLGLKLKLCWDSTERKYKPCFGADTDTTTQGTQSTTPTPNNSGSESPTEKGTLAPPQELDDGQAEVTEVGDDHSAGPRRREMNEQLDGVVSGDVEDEGNGDKDQVLEQEEGESGDDDDESVE